MPTADLSAQIPINLSPARAHVGQTLASTTVILSAAKDLAAPLPSAGVTIGGASQTLASTTVILSAAKDLAAPRARPFAAYLPAIHTPIPAETNVTNVTNVSNPAHNTGEVAQQAIETAPTSNPSPSHLYVRA